MLAFPGMIAESARKAGMRVPKNPDVDWNPNSFPHFHVFCNVQLGRPLVTWGEHWENAKIIVAIPKNKLKTITLEQILALGLSYAQ